MKKNKNKEAIFFIKKALKISSKKKISNQTIINNIKELDSFDWIMIIDYLEKNNFYLDLNKIHKVKTIRDLKNIVKNKK